MMNNQFSNVTIGYMGYICTRRSSSQDLAQLIEIEVWTIQNSLKQVKYFQN